MRQAWDSLDIGIGQVVLVVSPHPDDESLGCGGTIRSHVTAGGTVKIVFVTSGDRGAPGPTTADTVRIREGEAAAAALILGVDDIEFWRGPDGAVEAGKPLVGRLCDTIAELDPDVVYAPHCREMHRDHRAVGRAVIRAVGAVAPTRRPAVRLFEVWSPLHDFGYVQDISPHVDAKRAAIAAHQSQAALGRMDDALLGLARYRGQMFSGCPATSDYAEVFAAAP